MGASNHHAWPQKILYILILFSFGIIAHFGYATMHQDRILYRRAEQQLQAGNPERASHFYQQALDQGLQWPRALIRVVEAALKAGNLDSAVQGLNNLLDSKAKPLPTELLRLAGLFDQFDRPLLARDLLEHYPRQLMSSPELSFYLAGLYRRTGWVAEADLLYARLENIPEWQTAVAINRAEMASQSGRFDQAEHILRRLLDSDPDNRTARILLGRVLSWMGRIDEAILQYKAALGTQP
jgi:tetratricopeptide (TPR) repeat protein